MRSLKLAMLACAAIALTAPAASYAADAPVSSGAPMVPAPDKAQPAPPAAAADVDPEALAALRRMGAFLSTLNQFEVRTQTTLDLVTVSGQTVQLDGGAVYKVRRPNSFSIQVTTDRKNRSFIYDGKQLTIYAPNLEYYATTPAPATIRETLDLMWDKFHIPVPLDDLFRWGDPNDKRADKLLSAFSAGTATIDGTPTDHYVFREADIDWQVWIQQGAQALPRKIVITDRIDPANPTYIARLNWNLAATYTDQDFAFRPGKNDKSIQLTQFTP
jgi:hypothetical protein